MKKYVLEVANGGVALAAYLMGVLTGDEGLGDLNTVEWLGAVVFVGAVYGITARARNTPTEG